MNQRTRSPAEFQIGEELGRGGTAVVHRATIVKDKRRCALKTPLDNDLFGFAKLVRREWNLIAGLRCPGLVRLIDRCDESTPWLAMELCRGPSLEQLGRIAHLPTALNVISALAVDLEFLRLVGVVHGDFKPHNAFLPTDWEISLNRGFGWVKLSDFSLGRQTAEPDSHRSGLGTVGYMAPETIVNETTSHRSDLFALGVTAYFLLTGRHPFIYGETDPVKINSRCREDTPAGLIEQRPDLPSRVADLIEQLLSKAPEGRPSSAWEVCLGLEEAGATYPFRRALQASDAVDLRLEPTESLDRIVADDDPRRAELHTIANTSRIDLILVLQANQLLGNIQYDGERFRFLGPVRWPCCHRRRALRLFSGSSFGRKRDMVRRAVELSSWTDAETRTSHQRFTPTAILLRHFLSVGFVKRQSRAQALAAAAKHELGLAAQLWVQAGEIDRAEASAYEAALELHREHRSQEALEVTRIVIDYGTSIGRTFEIRQLLMTRADILKDLGDTEAARAVYSRLVELYRNKPADKLLAETYKDLGDLYKTRQQFDDGLEALEKALRIYTDLDDELEISHTLNNMGNIYWIAHDLDKGLGQYRAALKIQRRLKANFEIGSTLSNIGSIYAIRGRLDRGIRMLNLALGVKRELGNASEIGRTLNNLGYCYFVRGRMQKAVACLDESLLLNRRTGNQKEILFNLENLTSLLITTGELKKALTHLTEGLSLAEELSDQPHLAAFHLTMATVLRRLGRLGEAQRSLTRVRAISEEISDEPLEVRTETEAAAISQAMGHVSKAISTSQKASEMAERLGAKAEQLGALMTLLRAEWTTEISERADELCRELNLTRERKILEYIEWQHMLDADPSAIAGRKPEQLSTASDEPDSDIENALKHNLIAQVHLQAARPDDAERHLQEAMRLSETCGLIPERITTMILMGRAQLDQGDYERCFASLKGALKYCQQIAEGLPRESDRDSYLKQPEIQNLVSQIKSLSQRTGPRATS